MKHIIFVVFTFLSSQLWAQTLRQGEFLKPSEGAAELNAFLADYPTRALWESKRSLILKGILEGSGLKTIEIIKPKVISLSTKKKAEGYSVQNIKIKSLNGFFVSGNLYIPSNINGKIPAVLCPHGHFEDGRLQEYMQQRCATLARMGAIVFAYDMVGYGDALYADHKADSTLKLQLQNSISALNYLWYHPNVNRNKIGITGESGGGTQTFLLAAIDSRIAVSVPTVMVSSHFFGGCTCESGLPIHQRASYTTNNAEIAACMAPKPQLLISNGSDWTKFNPDVELPYLQKVYGLYSQKNKVTNVHLALEQHDYGYSKRVAMYQFMAKYLGLNLQKVMKNGQVNEKINTIYDKEELSVKI